MRFLLFIITCLGIVLMAESCKKECQDKSNPDCENYDPCYGKAKTSADFTISEVVSGFANETDEVFRMSYVQFEAKQDFDSYQWVIGNHPDTFRTKKCGLQSFPEGETITVRLIGKKQPNTQCFPDDDGIDTVIKKFRVSAADSLIPILGEYEGYYDAYPNQKVTVKIFRKFVLDGQNQPSAQWGIINIPVTNINGVRDELTLGSSVWYINGNHDGAYAGYRMQGYVYLSPDKKTLTATYNHWDTASRYPNFVRINGGFKGTRK
jgi:hypothetical protein